MVVEYGEAPVGRPNVPRIMACITKHVFHVIPALQAGSEYFRVLEQKHFFRLAILHFPCGAVVANALLRVVVEDDADVMSSVGDDYARLAVSDNSASNLGRHVLMPVYFIAVLVAHGVLHARSLQLDAA